MALYPAFDHLVTGEGAHHFPGMPSNQLVPLPAIVRLGPAGDLSFRIRLLRPDDEARYPEFLAHVSADDRRRRFFSAARLSARQIWSLTHPDSVTARVILAVDPDDDAIYGVARLHRVTGQEGEFAVLVRSDLKGRGLGHALMRHILRLAPEICVESVFGLILRDNLGMLDLARDLGFVIEADPADPALIRARLRRDNPSAIEAPAIPSPAPSAYAFDQ